MSGSVFLQGETLPVCCKCFLYFLYMALRRHASSEPQRAQRTRFFKGWNVSSWVWVPKTGTVTNQVRVHNNTLKFCEPFYENLFCPERLGQPAIGDPAVILACETPLMHLVCVCLPRCIAMCSPFIVQFSRKDLTKNVLAGVSLGHFNGFARLLCRFARTFQRVHLIFPRFFIGIFAKRSFPRPT